MNSDQSPTREELIERLKPCPFCGGAAAYRVNQVDFESVWGVACDFECGAWIDSCCDTKAEAAAIWNLRSDSQRIAELEGRLKDGSSSAESAARRPSDVCDQQPERSAGDLDPKYWEVEVRVCGERILTIGHSHLSGLADIDRYADVVRTCAAHLSSFIGPEEQPPCFACGGSEQERWMGPSGEEVGPCSVCVPAESRADDRPEGVRLSATDEQIDPTLQTQGADNAAK